MKTIKLIAFLLLAVICLNVKAQKPQGGTSAQDHSFVWDEKHKCTIIFHKKDGVYGRRMNVSRKLYTDNLKEVNKKGKIKSSKLEFPFDEMLCDAYLTKVDDKSYLTFRQGDRVFYLDFKGIEKTLCWNSNYENDDIILPDYLGESDDETDLLNILKNCIYAKDVDTRKLAEKEKDKSSCYQFKITNIDKHAKFGKDGNLIQAPVFASNDGRRWVMSDIWYNDHISMRLVNDNLVIALYDSLQYVTEKEIEDIESRSITGIKYLPKGFDRLKIDKDSKYDTYMRFAEVIDERALQSFKLDSGVFIPSVSDCNLLCEKDIAKIVIESSQTRRNEPGRYELPFKLQGMWKTTYSTTYRGYTTSETWETVNFQDNWVTVMSNDNGMNIDYQGPYSYEDGTVSFYGRNMKFVGNTLQFAGRTYEHISKHTPTTISKKKSIVFNKTKKVSVGIWTENGRVWSDINEKTKKAIIEESAKSDKHLLVLLWRNPMITKDGKERLSQLEKTLKNVRSIQLKQVPSIRWSAKNKQNANQITQNIQAQMKKALINSYYISRELGR